jgi:hypothetical protein
MFYKAYIYLCVYVVYKHIHVYTCGVSTYIHVYARGVYTYLNLSNDQSDKACQFFISCLTTIGVIPSRAKAVNSYTHRYNMCVCMRVCMHARMYITHTGVHVELTHPPTYCKYTRVSSQATVTPAQIHTCIHTCIHVCLTSGDSDSRTGTGRECRDIQFSVTTDVISRFDLAARASDPSGSRTSTCRACCWFSDLFPSCILLSQSESFSALLLLSLP